ncbi:granzyme B(G,H) isoform X1 [Etheostoma spectabile]|uniref:granzyme B(G,H) isoform X1 n=1 Tax=Etheostoma spectabile TaxID=54343 RepID=UPI0013AEA7CD|nr:granzyme B(G,H)-like isoform X1 [Etheostoma spectabile]
MHALHKFLLFHLLMCHGRQSIGSDIINGENVKEKLMLYMASVQNNKGHHKCGGFLIDKNFVLTAAHCDNMNPMSVVLGTHDLKKVDDSMRYNVTRCKHPSFVSVSKGDDIMLLKLSRKAQLNKRVKPVPLIQAKIKIKENAKCHVAGWGFTKTGGKVVNVLREVDVPIINLEDCKKDWASLRNRVNLPANVICAGGNHTRKGFCQGDSGGPLVCDMKAVGVVSFNMGNNCDYPNVPNVYTNISKYLLWIKKILKQNKC